MAEPKANSPAVIATGERVGRLLNEIALNFKAGAKLTLLVRPAAADDHSRDFVLTNDTLPAAIEALRARLPGTATLNDEVTA